MIKFRLYHKDRIEERKTKVLDYALYAIEQHLEGMPHKIEATSTRFIEWWWAEGDGFTKAAELEVVDEGV
jgi:hypothetical protein